MAKKLNSDAKVIKFEFTPRRIAIFSGLTFLLIAVATVIADDQLDKKYAENANILMHEECLKKCALYGASQNDLVGPKLEYAKHTRYYIDYAFSWRVERKNLTLRLHEHGNNRSSDPLMIDFKWIAANR